jgi:hypothetical protein
MMKIDNWFRIIAELLQNLCSLFFLYIYNACTIQFIEIVPKGQLISKAYWKVFI